MSKTSGGRRARKSVMALDAPASKGASALQTTVDVTFELDTTATNATLARVYLPGTTDPKNDIANNERPKGTLKNREVDSKFNVELDAAGNPGAVAVFNVKHAKPSKISVTMEDQPPVTVPMKVT